MNFKYSSLVLAALFALSYAQNENELKAYLQKYEDISKLVCDPSKPITDDQASKIDTTCKVQKETEEQVNKLMMSCLNIKDTITPKQKIASFCAPAKDCMVKSWTEIMKKLKPEEVTAGTANIDKYANCVKDNIK